ncbi:MAG: SDR family NAD(P)-dependent oxidoreductase [Planctomycetaceae bacterium]|nr:SDR family NAD(P)-dependent oxidoreductase [Planctomycetaceae bacterium]MBQ2820430.1 SDR family NAD(P)-dependent oxidoreductase [Thermoguttaceae bacterium]MDO4425164.1 SDR family NAD(P)-dependent oxidoreductase [Planctomycetia bacterium]
MAILILGATSEIARKNAEIFASRGEHLILAARDVTQLETWAPEDAQCVRYSAEENLRDVQQAETAWLQCVEIAQKKWDEPIRGVYLAQGFLPAEAPNWRLEEIGPSIFRNFTSLAIFLEVIAQWFETHPEKAKKSWITVISSVAGERGRYSNYPYGAAKAGLTAYLSGLRARLFPLGVHVLTVKPGLVKTRMIENRAQADSFTAVFPSLVADDIDRAVRRRQNVLYSPVWWGFVMFFVRMIPEWCFKRMKW